MYVSMYVCIKGTKCENIGTWFLQGSVVTQTPLDGLALHHPVANFLLCIIMCVCQKVRKLV